ncbi:MAG: hypothetical protein AAGI13_02160 [Pseudomonadota bacterium]
MRHWPALLICLTAAPAWAVEDYDTCTALIAADPAAAAAGAQVWARFGGGWPARHCHALALLALGAERKAALEIAAIARDASDLPADIRAEMFVEAGEIFLDLGELGETAQAVERADRLDPRSRGARLLSAALAARFGDWAGAEADLTQAIDRAGPDAETLSLRATAKRRGGDAAGARTDAYWAQELAPESPAVWLEIGEVEALLGNRAAARAAWLSAIRLAGAEDPLAGIARQKLQLMDLN